MSRALLGLALVAAIAVLLYLLVWPVPIEPVAWRAPPDAGYSNEHASNDRLAQLQRVELGPHRGPEDVAADARGTLYTGTDDGLILRIDADGQAGVFANVGGRPLGLEFDAAGALLIANAYLGLQRVTPDGKVTLLTDRVAGTAIGYADDLDIAPDGKVFFTDASTKFTPAGMGGTYAASLPDILEHGGNGRLLMYDPAERSTVIVLDGLQFANGVAVDPFGQFVLVIETGAYRVIRLWFAGARAGEREVLVDNLPGFPDNLNRGLAGRYWIGLVSPRSALLDALSGWPAVRKMVQRLPAALRPAAGHYSHVVAIDANGRVTADLQHDGSVLPAITGVLETRDTLFFSSLFGSAIGRMANPQPPARAGDERTLVSAASSAGRARVTAPGAAHGHGAAAAPPPAPVSAQHLPYHRQGAI